MSNFSKQYFNISGFIIKIGKSVGSVNMIVRYYISLTCIGLISLYLLYQPSNIVFCMPKANESFAFGCFEHYILPNIAFDPTIWPQKPAARGCTIMIKSIITIIKGDNDLVYLIDFLKTEGILLNNRSLKMILDFLVQYKLYPNGEYFKENDLEIIQKFIEKYYENHDTKPDKASSWVSFYLLGAVVIVGCMGYIAYRKLFN